MNLQEGIDFGKLWLDANGDAADSETYQFFNLAVKSFEAWNSTIADIDVKFDDIGLSHSSNQRIDFYNDVKEIISKHLNSVDDNPAKGKWIVNIDNGTAACSVCRSKIYPQYMKKGWPNFCGNCGLKMEE